MVYRILTIILLCLSVTVSAQIQFNLDSLPEIDFNKLFKKHLKFATVYGALNGGTSLSDKSTFSVTSGQLEEGVILTPYDYSITLGIDLVMRIKLIHFMMVRNLIIQMLLQ